MTADELQKIRQQEFDKAKKLLMDRNDELTQEIHYLQSGMRWMIMRWQT